LGVGWREVRCELDYDPAGLVCTMEIPLDAVVPDIDGNG